MIIPNSSARSRTRSPPPQASRAEPTTSRDNREVGISPIIPTSELVDNLSAHKAPEVMEWLADPKRARWHVHFTPTSSSWLNLVERWFKELTDRRLRRGTFSSVPALVEAIEIWAEHWNDDPKPFIWHKAANDIIEKVRRGRLKLHQINPATDN